MTGQLVWLITGAAKGLGLALARRALLRGDLVVATARNITRFETALFSDPAIDRGCVHVLALDIFWPIDDLKRTMAEAAAHWGRVDVLVNNAGAFLGLGLSEEVGSELFAKFMQSFFGTINVTNALLPHMRAQRSGTVIVVGSRAPFKNNFSAVGPYLAVKAALHSYGETLSAELRQFNIRVLITLPGAFNTDPGGGMPVVGTPITDYDTTRNAIRRYIKERIKHAGEQGDPEKGMNVVVDVVRGEGCAVGKQGWPLWLVLGDDGLVDVKGRLELMGKTVDEWESVGTGLGQE